MTAAITGLKPLVIPDSEALVAGGASPELMALVNDIARRFDLIAGYQAPVIPDDIVIQVRDAVDGTAKSTTTTIPIDNTIPQRTEGAELQSLSFTPKLADSKIRIEWTGFISGAAAANSFAIVALFQSGANDAIDTKYGFHDSTVLFNWTPKLSAVIDSWGVAARTISIRYGGSAGETIYVGSTVGGAARFGGTMNSVLTITEYKNPT
jgi:hypothetical protein